MRYFLLSSVAAAAIAAVTTPIAATATNCSLTARRRGVELDRVLCRRTPWCRLGPQNWSDPFPGAIFGDRVNVSGAVAGGQIGFDCRVGAFVGP